MWKGKCVGISFLQRFMIPIDFVFRVMGSLALQMTAAQSVQSGLTSVAVM